MNTDFAQILKTHRQREGVSQAELAERLGVSRNYVSLIERGVRDNVSWKLGCKILDLCAGLQNATCSTCNHWRHIRDEDYEDWPGPHGECGLLDEDSQGEAAWLSGIVVIDERPYPAEDLSLITKPEFGCSEWEGSDK